MCINVHEFASLSQDITACKATPFCYSASKLALDGWNGETANKQMLLVQTNCSNKQLNWKDPVQCIYKNYIYYIDKSVLVENRPLIKISISSLVQYQWRHFPLLHCWLCKNALVYIIKRKLVFTWCMAWRYEFYFLVVKNNIFLTRCARSWNIVFTNWKIKFISSRHRVIFSIYMHK